MAKNQAESAVLPTIVSVIGLVMALVILIIMGNLGPTAQSALEQNESGLYPGQELLESVGVLGVAVSALIASLVVAFIGAVVAVKKLT